MLFLIGCSDAHNNQPFIEASNEGSTTLQVVSPTATQISAEEFSGADFTGIWKRRFILNSTKDVSISTNEEGNIPALESRTDSYLDVISVEQIDETSTRIKYCDSLPAKLIEIDPENSIVIDSTSDSATTPPENSRIAKHYKISDDHYRIDLYTNDNLDGYFELEKHSSLLAFDFGMFSYSMTNKAVLNASEHVCGKVSRSTVTLTDSLDDANTFNPISAQFNAYSISAPYENSFVTIEMSFIGEIKEAPYSVVKETPETTSQIKVLISSPEFNAPSSGDDTTTAINGSTGSVTIGSISDTSVSGDYDITLENGEILTGNFSFEIK